MSETGNTTSNPTPPRGGSRAPALAALAGIVAMRDGTPMSKRAPSGERVLADRVARAQRLLLGLPDWFPSPEVRYEDVEDVIFLWGSPEGTWIKVSFHDEFPTFIWGRAGEPRVRGTILNEDGVKDVLLELVAEIYRPENRQG